VPDATAVYRPTERAARRVDVGAEYYTAMMEAKATGGFDAL
jgi:hypothetical protein